MGAEGIEPSTAGGPCFLEPAILPLDYAPLEKLLN